MAIHTQTSTMNAPSYNSQTLDHLGLVAGMVDELGLVPLIDQMLPKSVDDSPVSSGRTHV